MQTCFTWPAGSYRVLYSAFDDFDCVCRLFLQLSIMLHTQHSLARQPGMFWSLHCRHLISSRHSGPHLIMQEPFVQSTLEHILHGGCSIQELPAVQLDMPAVYAAGGVGDELSPETAEAQLSGLGLAATPSMQRVFTLLKLCALLLHTCSA